MRVEDVRFEHHRHAIGVGESRPRVSWRVTGTPAGWAPTAYELEATDPVTGRTDSTGRIASIDSVLVAWPFDSLLSRARRDVRVRVWGRDAIEAHRGVSRPGSRRASSTMVVVEENGTRVSEERFAPGWTNYAHRLRVRTHDVTSLLRQGTNAVRATLADGWSEVGSAGRAASPMSTATARLCSLNSRRRLGERSARPGACSWSRRARTARGSRRGEPSAVLRAHRGGACSCAQGWWGGWQ